MEADHGESIYDSITPLIFVQPTIERLPHYHVCLVVREKGSHVELHIFSLRDIHIQGQKAPWVVQWIRLGTLLAHSNSRVGCPSTRAAG